VSELVTSLRAVSWRLRNGEDVPPMEKALIELCGQAADELTRLREAAQAVVDFHKDCVTGEPSSRLIGALRETL
jgi:hypothetical protein